MANSVGTTGDDLIHGSTEADTLDGQAGNDTLDGGAGDDTYLFGLGDGQDVIFASTAQVDTGQLPRNTLRLRPGLVPTDAGQPQRHRSGAGTGRDR
jgi:Ca2+-binding RTX toxin-like protein